uniref:Putative glycerol uptake protein n=1 Tax=Trypanosoma congolense (strain IL3000) TaxID=1068625 RepID=G0UYX0_TRYCI|nr:putative glycerol uptake protein [Trypanosoma congolense IL3000]
MFARRNRQHSQPHPSYITAMSSDASCFRRKFVESFMEMLGDIYTPLKTGLRLEHVVYNACYMLIMLYGFIEVAKASRTWSSEFQINPPRWRILTVTSFGSVGYNGLGDIQWRSIDEGFVHLSIIMGVFVMGARAVRQKYCGGGGARVLQWYYVASGLFFMSFLHGPILWVPVALIAMNYVFGVTLVRSRLPPWLFLTVMWSAVVSLMLSAGYYGNTWIIGPKKLGWWVGMVSWVPTFNMSILRMISFNTDLHEASTKISQARAVVTRKHDENCLDCARFRAEHPNKDVAAVRCYKFRSDYPHNPEQYDLLSYMAYMLYPPLYIGGPMSSFNAFLSHCHHATVSMSSAQLIVYAMFILILYAAQVSMLHFIYLSALRKRADILLQLSPTQIAFTLYYSLAFLWLKFSLVWKTGRLAAVADGIDVPEDMRRCYSNTLSLRDFWRDWHASFNVWVVRYMYIPMGGNKYKYVSILPIFLFIAVWHDLELHLIEWAAWTISFFLVELLVGHIWGLPRFAWLRNSKYERMVRTTGGMFTVFGLVLSNMVGFATVWGRTGDSVTGRVIMEMFKASDGTFFFFFLIFFFLLSATGVLLRDEEATQIKWLKERYGIHR